MLNIGKLEIKFEVETSQNIESFLPHPLSNDFLLPSPFFILPGFFPKPPPQSQPLIPSLFPPHFYSTSLVTFRQLQVHSPPFFGVFAPLQHLRKPLKNESFTLLAAACLSRFGETTTSCPVCSDPTGVDCENREKKRFTRRLVTRNLHSISN